MKDLKSGIEHLKQAKAHMSEANGIMSDHISKLKALEEEIVKAEAECKHRREITVKQNTAFETARQTLAERQKAIEICREELQGVLSDRTVLDEASLAKVAARAERYEKGVSLSTLESCVKSVEMQILNDNRLAEKTAALSLVEVTNAFGKFLEKWPAHKARRGNSSRSSTKSSATVCRATKSASANFSRRSPCSTSWISILRFNAPARKSSRAWRS